MAYTGTERNIDWKWCWDVGEHAGKLPDEKRRQPPKNRIIAQGLHPHPGPAMVDCGFDDAEGPDWEEEVDEAVQEKGQAKTIMEAGLHLRKPRGPKRSGNNARPWKWLRLQKMTINRKPRLQRRMAI